MEQLVKSESPVIEKKASKVGLFIMGVTGSSLLLIVGVSIPFVTPALRRYCLPYVPATSTQISNVVKGLQGRSGSLVDLGSGDGRIVVEMARHGFLSVGIELNLWLVWYSRLNSWKVGASARFIRKDMWEVDLSKYNNIVIFGTEQLMPDLEKKLVKELSEDGRIVACRFPLPNWKPASVLGEGIDRVWIYDKNINKA